jgi:hypothetical protein
VEHFFPILDRFRSYPFSRFQTFFSPIIYQQAVEHLRWGRFEPLEVERKRGDLYWFIVKCPGTEPRQVVFSFRARQQAGFHDWCDCEAFAKGNVCWHAALARLVLWLSLHPANEGHTLQLLPSVEEKIQSGRLLLAEFLPDELKTSDPAVRFKGLLYCLPDEDAWKRYLGEPLSFESPSKLPTLQWRDLLPMPVTKLPAVSPQNTAFSIPEISWDQIPYELCERDNRFLGTYGRPEGALQVKRLIQYLFTDGTVLEASEVFFHRLGRLIPRELLPVKITPINRPEDLFHELWLGLDSWGPGVDQGGAPRLPSFTEFPVAALTAFQAVLSRAGALSLQREPDEFEIFATAGQQRQYPRKIARLQSLHFFSPARLKAPGCPFPVQWKLRFPEPGVLSLSLVAAGEREIQFGQGALLEEGAPDAPRLTFHPLASWLEAAHGLVEEGTRSPVEKKSPLKISGHLQIERFLITFKERLASSTLPLPWDWKETRIPSHSVCPEIFLNDQGGLRYALSFPWEGREIQVFNLPIFTRKLIASLTGGIRVFGEYDPLWYAAPVSGIKAERDRYVFKQVGLYWCYVFEAIQFLEKLKANGEAGGDVELPVDWGLFHQEINPKIVALLEAMGGRELFPKEISKTEPWTDLCSPAVPKILESFLKSLETAWNSEQRLFLEDGAWVLAHSVRPSLILVRSLMEHHVNETTGRCFLKTHATRFEEFLNWAHYESGDLAVRRDDGGEEAERGVSYSLKRPKPKPKARAKIPHPPAPDAPWKVESGLVHSLLSLENHGFRIFFDGQGLSELNPDDFKAEFRVGERPPAPASLDGSQLIRESLDWFELHPRFFFRGVEISIDEAEKLSREGIIRFQGKIYRVSAKGLPSAKRLESFWERISQARKDPLSSAGWDAKGGIRVPLPKNATLEMLALRASGIPVEGDEAWQEICRFYDGMDEPREQLELPETIRATLKPYQRLGVQWLLDLYRLRLGGILADDMGLGKTLQALAFLEVLRSEGKLGPTLIIVPTSLTSNWLSEARKFVPELPIRAFDPKEKDEISRSFAEFPNAVLVSTYGLLLEHEDFLQSLSWNIQIYDEAQALKNMGAQRTSAARRLRASFKLCLTGTPLENHLGEFYSLLDLVVPGSLGDLDRFQRRYVTRETLDPAAMVELRAKVKPLILRRNKSQILRELPPKTETTLKLPFDPRQRKIYRDIASAWNAKVKESIRQYGEARSRIMMLTALLRLRQACSDPAGIPNVRYAEVPPKIATLTDALQTIINEEESAVVFTQFISTYNRVISELGRAGIPCFHFCGATPPSGRDHQLQAFKAHAAGSVLVLTLKTGGVGLNLTKAGYVFHLDPWWNPAVENQATDRTHRIGQDKHVQVYRYLMEGSVEEKIEILKSRKAAQFTALFGEGLEEGLEPTDGAQGGSPISKKDFDYLLTLTD